MARSKRDPFSVKLDADRETELVAWLSTEIDNAINARIALVGSDGDIDYWHKLYEGGDRTIVRTTPWPGAANLTSVIGTEKVDALRARIMKTVAGRNAEPLWVIEGWGASAKRAPFVESFHEWKRKEERFEHYLKKVIHNSLIETVGVLEVYEGAERRRQQREMEVVVETNEDSSPKLQESGEPIFARDDTGDLIPAETNPDLPSARVLVDDFVTLHRGPRYRVIPVRDFLMFPGHAMDYDHLWGYGKRFWRRVPELKEQETLGRYRNVSRLDESDERTQVARDTEKQQDIVPQYGPTAEKELWEIPFRRDLDEDGFEEWYIATLSATRRVLLRLQKDDVGRPRYVVFVPFPRPDSVWGYSLIGHKLINLIEEDSVTMRQIADRGSLVNAAPIKRVMGALWDPKQQPFGPRAVIDVRDLREVEPMTIPDVPPSMIEHKRDTRAQSERVAGMNDTAVGQLSRSDNTLGEIQLAVEQSFVRMDEIVDNINEALEDVWALRHLFWIRALEDTEEDAPERVTDALEVQGLTLENGKFTADLLRGNFIGKPSGSVATADLTQQRGDMLALVVFLERLAARVPAIAQKFSDPAVIHALMEQAVRVFRVPDKQAFLKNLDQATMESMAAGSGDGNGGLGTGGLRNVGGLGGLEAVLGPLAARMGRGLPAESPVGPSAGPESL